MKGTILILLVIVALLLKLFIRSPSHKGRIGENKVSNILKTLPQTYRVINNVVIPNQKITSQVDHVIVSPYGVFVIETKNYSGWIWGAENSEKWKQTFRTTKGAFFRNPIKQNWGHVYALSEYLNIDKKVFKPIIVFSNKARLYVRTATPVIYMTQLKTHIMSYNQEIISREDVQSIYGQISKTNLVGSEIGKRHVQQIKNSFEEKNEALKKGICPRCGGALVLRNGRYGIFYGCVNYPACRFTFNPKR